MLLLTYPFALQCSYLFQDITAKDGTKVCIGTAVFLHVGGYELTTNHRELNEYVARLMPWTMEISDLARVMAAEVLHGVENDIKMEAPQARLFALCTSR